MTAEKYLFCAVVFAALTTGCGVLVEMGGEFSADSSGPVECANPKCHPDFTSKSLASKYGKAKNVHKPAADQACSVCHLATESFKSRKHSADSFAQQEEKAICLSCHEAFAKTLSERRYNHPLIEQGKCSPCHDPHGSSSPAFLRETATDVWGSAECWKSAPLLDKAVPICLKCHDESLFTIKAGADTKFRNGRTNLHYRHVETYRTRCGPSRTLCSNCHEIHSADNKRLIKSITPTGMMKDRPFEFKLTENGGSCNVTCHKPVEYDRRNSEGKP